MGLNKLVDARDQRYVLFEMLNIDKLSDEKHFLSLTGKPTKPHLNWQSRLQFLRYIRSTWKLIKQVLNMILLQKT